MSLRSHFQVNSKKVVIVESENNTYTSCIVHMDCGDTLVFTGYLRLRLMQGKIIINGKEMEYHQNSNENQSFTDLYSSPLYPTQCLFIKALPSKSKQKSTIIELQPLQQLCHRLKKIIDKSCDSIFQIIGCHFIFDMDSTNAHVQNQYQSLFIPESWTKCANYLRNEKPSSILICGHSQSGKSTFARYLTNTLLNNCKCVAYLDLDIGQNEFSSQGLISITLINDPLFGHPHTHIMQHANKCLKSYFVGSNDPTNDPQFYIQCIEQLFNDWKEYISNVHACIPLIINTCGFVSNLGSKLLQNILCIIQPQHMIEVVIEDKQLLNGIEMQYLADIKAVVNKLDGNSNAQQKRKGFIHHWKDIRDVSDIFRYDGNSNDSLLMWYSKLRKTQELGINIDWQELKPKQKIWCKYLSEFTNLTYNECSDSKSMDGKWFENTPMIKEKTKQEIHLFKIFVNCDLHFIESTGAVKVDENVQLLNGKQKAFLSMISYFTQELFIANPAKYLISEKTNCYQIPFSDICVLFLNDEILDYSLILHALNGVIIGLCIKTIVDDGQFCEPLLKRRKLGNNDWRNSLRVINNGGHHGNGERIEECVGLGIIRSIDCQQRVFFVITPVMECKLNDVNLFVRGSNNIELPSVLMFDESMADVPSYIDCWMSNERILRRTA